MTQQTPDYRHLHIVGFTVDAMQPLALFKDDTAETTFPLWLEMVDVLAITAELVTRRLAGKDERSELLDSILATVGLRIADILVDGTAGSGYRADVCLEGEDGPVRVRVDLVTALLTAIKYKLPVGISEEALASSSLVDHSGIEGDGLPDEKRLLEMLEKMNPEEMGKYPM
jgi:bifunctional DNase/RNase